MKKPMPIDENALDIVDTNQTLFSSEEPFFQKSSLPADPATAAAGQLPKKKPPIIFLALGALGVVFLILISALLLLPKATRPTLVSQPSPTPVSQAEMTDQQKRVEELQSDLKSADPTLLDLPFPQVRSDISLLKSKN